MDTDVSMDTYAILVFVQYAQFRVCAILMYPLYPVCAILPNHQYAQYLQYVHDLQYTEVPYRVVQGYTGLYRGYTGFIQGYTRVISQTRVTTFNEGNEGNYI